MDQGNDFLKDRFIERVILLALLAALVFVCIQIVSPFIGPMLWGVIIAVAIWHPYRKLSRALGDRRVVASIIVSVVLLLILVVPISLLVDSLAESVRGVAGLMRDLTTHPASATPDLGARSARDRYHARRSVARGHGRPAGLAAATATLYRHGRRLCALHRRRARRRHDRVPGGDRDRRHPARDRRGRRSRCFAASSRGLAACTIWACSTSPPRRSAASPPGSSSPRSSRPCCWCSVSSSSARPAPSCSASSPSSSWSSSCPTGWSGCRW